MNRFNKVFMSAVIAFSFGSSGCALLLIGAGAAGGYAISQDEVEFHTAKSYDRAWDAVRSVLMKEGAVTQQDFNAGTMSALVYESEVKIRIMQAAPKDVKVIVQARKTKGLLPDLDLAQSIATKSIRNLG